MIVKHKNKKVVIAMSGGIDSSVAGALLKKQGFDVVGVFMKFWTENTNGAENRCCSLQAENRARAVAKILDIPFCVFDFQKQFKKTIVDYFLKEHKAGRTPNPCVLCNKKIKFGLLLEKALELNADFIATGHYARLRREIPMPKSQIPKIRLLKGKDKQKDQSYFLWQLNQKQLSKILFPVGNYTKTEVKKLAKKFKLPVLKISESMEICFIPKTTNDFLKKYIKPKPGPIICLNSGFKQMVGKHQGLWRYTIGQRKGIGLSGGPYFVLDKNLKTNTLIVTKNENDLYKKQLICKNVNWISRQKPEFPLRARVKIRYGHSPALAIIQSTNKKMLKVVFKRSQRAITPGQSVVFYRNSELLGGGIIKS